MQNPWHGHRVIQAFCDDFFIVRPSSSFINQGAIFLCDFILLQSSQITELPFSPPEEAAKAGGASDGSTPTEPASKWPSLWVNEGSVKRRSNGADCTVCACVRVVQRETAGNWIKHQKTEGHCLCPVTQRSSSSEKECVLKVLLQEVSFFVSILQKHQRDIPQLWSVRSIE